MAIKSKTLGPHHPSTINSMHGKAKALRGLNRFAEALPLLQDVLAQRLKVNGDLSKPVQQAYDELASIKQDLGCFEQAAAGYQKSLDLARRLAGGNDSLDTAIAINNFATLLQDQGKLELAEAQFRESLKQRRSLLGTKHPAVARASFNLARVLLDQGKHAQALPLVEESLAIRTELLPPLHPDRLASLLLQARLQLISGELSQGEASWQSVQTLMRSAPQPQWPISLQVMLLRTQALRAELHGDKAAQIRALNAALTTLQTNQASPAKLAAAQKELQQAEGVAVEPDKGVTTSVAKVCSP